MPNGIPTSILTNIPNLWIVLGAGVGLWLLSQALPSDRRAGGGAWLFARLFSLLGLAAIGVGLYAGFMGPVTIGPVIIGRFPFAGIIQQSKDEALSYACSNLEISRHPAVGWVGSSKTTLEYTVKNKGNRSISRLIIRFMISDGSTVNMPLDGNFSAGQTVGAIITPPPNAMSSYFSGSVVNPSVEVVGARF